MLEKLYLIGCLDYQRLIRVLYSKLNLTERTCLVLMGILDSYSFNQELNVDDLSKSSGIDKEIIENAIVELLNKDYIQIDLVMLDGKSHESYRITPFFLKCEKLLTEIKNSKQETDISHIIAMLEINLKRPLSRTEQETVSGWFEDSFTKSEIETAIKYVMTTKNVFRLQSVNKELYKDTKVSSPTTNETIKGVFDKMVNR